MINVIDDVCGAGKTTYIINEMKNGIKQEDKKYIFVTPFKEEIKRILKVFPNEFQQPEYKNASNGTKLTDLKQLLHDYSNIATTHALFKMIDGEVIDLLKQRDYTLIVDEVLDVVDVVNVTPSDMDAMFNTDLAIVDSNNKIVWKNDEYTGKFNDYKRWAQGDNLYSYTGKNGKSKAFIWNFPQQIFTLFQNTYILTYMFDCQPMAYYLNAHNIPYTKYSLDNGTLSKYQFNKIDKNLVNILQGKAWNNIGEKRTALSKAWLTNPKINAFGNTNAKELSKLLGRVRRYGAGFTVNKQSISTKDMIWTTAKRAYNSDINKVEVGDRQTGFLALNARSTNKYSNRHFILYAANLFFNPVLKNYFRQQNITVNEDDWALSMLIQFICRSAIRKNEEIYLYIPSKRMRELLINYLEM